MCLTKKIEDESSQMRIFFHLCDQIIMKLNVGLDTTIFLGNESVHH